MLAAQERPNKLTSLSVDTLSRFCPLLPLPPPPPTCLFLFFVFFLLSTAGCGCSHTNQLLDGAPTLRT